MMENTTIAENAHIAPGVLRELLTDVLGAMEEQIGERVTLEPLGRLKELADATTKVLVRTISGPIAVIICSRPAAPDLVARGSRNAEKIRNLIGETLGDAIIRPMGQGEADGRSYAIFPYCRDLSKWRPLRIAQRLRIQGALLTWLRQATVKASERHGADGSAAESFADVLEHLGRQALFDDGIQRAIRHALKRLELGEWRPGHTFDHNDLYLSNIMLPVRSGPSGRPRYPFVLIDWAGANPKGFGIYDLIRLARAINLSPGSLRRELSAHSEALQCRLQDSPGHLLASLGWLHKNREHFPEHRYVKTVQACWATLDRAMPSLASCT